MDVNLLVAADRASASEPGGDGAGAEGAERAQPLVKCAELGVMQRNVLGDELVPCSHDPLTGYYRTGCCENRGDDPGMHVVCCQVTEEFLRFEAEHGNDLSTPVPEYGFAGLVPGDQWCVCAARWAEALTHGMACPVVLESTHVSALEFVSLDDLRAHAVK